MATPLFTGTTGFRTISTEEIENRRAMDTVIITRRGSYDELDTESASWTKGMAGTTLGYPFMTLAQKRTRSPQSPWAEVILQFEGFIGTTTVNPISIEDGISLMATTLTSDENDANGNPTNVQVQFYGQVTTTRWIHYGTTRPTTPQYKGVVPSTVSVGQVFNPFPAQYNGTLQAKSVGRLDSFQRMRITEGVWIVSETWANRVEPAETIRITTVSDE